MLAIWLLKFLIITSQGQRDTGRMKQGKNGEAWATPAGTLILITRKDTSLDLRGNYYLNNEDRYPHYLNYDGIEVSKISDIPCDYAGAMCVPITFLNVYNPEQFEILGLSNVGDLLLGAGIVGREWLDLYRAQGGKGHISPNMKSLISIDDNGKAVLYYRRLAIRNKAFCGENSA